MEAIVLQFLTDDRTLLIVVLIAIDLVTGIISALRSGVFVWKRVADFYRASVLPGVLGYGLVYAIALGADRFPEVRGLVEVLTQWAGAGLVIAALLGSIASNMQTPGKAAPPRPV
jgi:hypothetical protein